MNRWRFSGRLPDGATIYTSSHEVNNNVDVILPPGYFGPDRLNPPQWISLKFELEGMSDADA